MNAVAGWMSKLIRFMHALTGLRIPGWSLVACVALCASMVAAAERVDYDRQILPILSDNCYKCHGPDEGARKAHLRLDTKDGAFSVKDGKAILVPGKSDQSELIRRITSNDPDQHMPPAASHRTLTSGQIELIRNWVDQGAKWEMHWAFVPPIRPAVPAASDPWCRNDIDRLVLADLKKAGLTPSKEATRERLIRRVSFDLTGLPPTPQELTDFVNDTSPDAYEKARRSASCVATLWRANGCHLARPGALCRHARLSVRPLPRRCGRTATG